MTSLERFERWFIANCDGDWEHGAGIAISSLDNPGWSVDINLRGTSLEDRSFAPVKREISENDWHHASIDASIFKIRCGPLNLEGAIALFCDWAEASVTSD